ncbi:MAG: hypothetical protein WCC79_00075 [Nitrososphaeraceae archaeon]
MTLKTRFKIFSISVLIFVICSTSQLQLGNGQIESWKKYDDPGKRFTFLYPPNWVANTNHIDASGFTEVTLTNPNSTRMKVSVVYTSKDSFLDSNTGKPVLASRALTDLEEEISADYIFFNSTGKFPHKYVVRGYNSASDLIDYEKIEGQPGRMLIVLSKVTDQDSLLFTYSESKRLFYKSLSNASQIVNSIFVY